MANPVSNLSYLIPFSEFVAGVSGSTYVLTLEHALPADHYIELALGNSDISGRADEANEHHCHVVPPTTGATTITIARDKASPASALELLVNVVECSDNTSAQGFTLRGAFQLVFGTGDLTKSTAHAGVVDSGQCQAILGGAKSAATGAFEKSRGLARVRHTATHVEASRITSGKTMTVSVFLIEWGSDVTVELVEYTAATQVVGGDLSTSAQWTTKAITSVVAANAFLSASFTTKTSSTPGNYAESIVCVLGDGETVGTSETNIAVGSWKGGIQTAGWIYVVSCAAWSVSRFTSAHGVLVGYATLSTTLAISPPAGTETYTTVSNVERTKGARLVRSNQSCEYQNTSEFYLSQHNARISAAAVLSYSRGTTRSPVTDPYGNGYFAAEIVDFDGSSAGDPDDIDGTESDVEVSQNHSIVADGLMPTTVSVTVKDSTAKFVPSVDVKLTLSGQAQQTVVANSIGVAVFTLTSAVVGTKSLSILMGASEVAAVSPPSIDFVTPPTNWGLTDKPAVNIGLIAEFSENQPFLDLCKTAKVVIGERSGSFDVQAKQSFNDEGYQIDCALDEKVSLVLTQAGRGSWDAGEYVFTYGFEGGAEWLGFTTAEVALTGVTTLEHTMAGGVGRIRFSWDGAQDILAVLKPSVVMTVSNFLRDFQCVEKSIELTYDAAVNPWRQTFLDRLEPFLELRFMDFTQTNYTWVQNWAERPGPQSFTTRRYIYDDDNPTVRRYLGAPWELAVDLVNRLGKDMAVNIPDTADNAYSTSLATLLRATVNPEQMIKLEESNERWNPAFPQSARRADLLAGYGLSDTPNNRFAAYAIRSCEIFKLFEDVFVDDQQRITRCIAGQSGNPASATQILSADLSLSSMFTSGIAADKVGPFHGEYSFAPYFGNNVEETTAQAAFDAALVEMDTKLDPITGDVAIGIANARAQRADIRFGCYEAGQHLTSGGTMTDAVVRDANRLPAFRAAVEDYCNKVSVLTGGATITWFSDCFDDTSGNAWGLLNTPAALTEVSMAGRYKYLGYTDWVSSLGLGSGGILGDMAVIKPLQRFLDVVGDGSGSNAGNVDGTSTPVILKLAPTADEYFSVQHLIISVIAAGAFDFTKYGASTVLAGVATELKLVEDDGTITDLFSGEDVYNNGGLLNHGVGEKVAFSNGDILTVMIPLYGLSLVDGDEIRMTINADLSGLLMHTAKAVGTQLEVA